MAGYIKVEVEKLPTKVFNIKIDSTIFLEFQKKAKQNNIPMNVLLETFARQYTNDHYKLNEKTILIATHYPKEYLEVIDEIFEISNKKVNKVEKIS